MASFDYRLNPLYAIKECSSCGALYTADFCCSKGGLEDKILVPKSPQNCATCGDPVDGLNCRPCAFVRKSDFYHEEFADEPAHIISPPEYDSFLFKIEPDQGELTNVVIEEVDTFLVPEDSIPPGIESNFDPGGGEIVVSQNIKDDDSFTFVIRTFLPFLTYPTDSPLLLSIGSEDTIFDPGYPDFED
ncbi:hypothetical protein Tco_1146381 [Tanacetum coccineum]